MHNCNICRNMQEQIQKIFQLASEIDSAASRAFIFSGEHGSGKTSTARKIVEGYDSELLWIDTKQERTSVDHIRNVHEFVSKTAYSNKLKIVVIDSVDDLTISGANALLKPLEEPVGNCCFILISSNVKLLPSTIKSRCINIRFSRSKNAESWDKQELDLYNQMLSALDIFTTKAEVLHNFIDSNFIKEDSSTKWKTFKVVIRHLTVQLIKDHAILNTGKSIMSKLALYTEVHKLIYYTDKLNLSVYNTVLLILYKTAFLRRL